MDPTTLPPPRRRWPWLAAPLALCAALGAGAAALLHSEAGSVWLLARVPGLTLEGWQGTLAGGSARARQLRWQGAAGQLQVDGLALDDLRWSWRPRPGAWLGLDLTRAQATQVAWHSAPQAPRSAPPDTLGLPLALSVARLQVDRLQVDALPAVQALQATLALGPDEHRLSQLSARTDRATLAGQLTLGARAPLPLQAEASLASLAGADNPWQARLGAQGPLARLALQARLQGSGSPAPALDAEAELRPFDAWPLGALQLSTQALDLAALHGGWPRTRLSGRVDLAARQEGAPLQFQAKLDNAAAGPWSAGALPLQQLQLQARATLDARQQLQQLALDSLQARLGERGEGGQLQGQLRWQDGALQGRLSLTQLQPAALDRRLPAMRLSGPLDADVQGLPAPAWLQGVGADWSPAALRGHFDAQWQGQLSGSGAPATALRLEAEAAADEIRLHRIEARAGQALAQLQGRIRPPAEGGRWQWQLQGTLRELDPSVWWPGEPGSAWRRGPHRLNARLASEASLPARLPGGWPALAAAWQGSLALQLEPSQLAGVALQGQLRLQRPAEAWLDAALEAGGNHVALQARGDTAAPNWQLQAHAPQLAALAPLARLLDPDWAPSAGSLQAQGRLDGGADWRLQGQAQLRQLKLPSAALASADLSLQLGRSPDSPLQLGLQAQQLQAGGGLLDQLQATLQGSPRQHQLALAAELPARPPAWLEQALGARSGNGTRLQLAGDGGWLAEADGSGQWHGRLAELRLHGRQASGPDWLAARDLGLSLKLDAQGRPRQARLQAGQLKLPDTALHWREAQLDWLPSQALPQMQLDARLEPFAVAPLLERLQPELGWRGDLRLGGTLQLRTGPRFDADLVFERQGGDLSIVDDVRDPTSRVQALGLSDLRLAMSAHDGLWHFTHALAGQRLGEMSGVATLHTRPERAWPEAQAPLDGVMQLRVANLGAWGAWVPPGWRLGGELRSSLALGGHFGATQLTGRLEGERLVARHALLGINLSDGRIAMRLDGNTAHIETFSFRGGDGQLDLRGEASLGERPELRLKALADRFQVLNRADRRLVTSGEATLSLQRERWALDGQVRVDEGLIDLGHGDAPELDGDVSFAGAAGTASAAEPAAPARATRAMLMKVRLDLGEKLRVRGRGLDALLRGELLASAANGRLSLNGTVRTQDGHYVAYGQKLEIERGVLVFTGPIEDPRLDIFAVRPNLDVRVGVAVTGSAMNPRVRLASEPEMSDSYKLSWLMLGREPDGLGQADTALLQRAAVALLSGEGEAPTDAFMRSLGITDYSLRQATDGNDARQTVVSLGRQLSRHWYVGYERGVNATTGTWQLVYRLAQRFTLRAQSGQDNAIDMIWSWRWP